MKIINNPHDFFNRLGNLHDARIDSLHWLPEESCLQISIDDLNSNFEGLPEYEGCKPNTIIFEGISEIEGGFNSEEDHLNIHEFTVEVVKVDLLSVEIKCWPGGKISVKCASLNLANS